MKTLICPHPRLGSCRSMVTNTQQQQQHKQQQQQQPPLPKLRVRWLLLPHQRLVLHPLLHTQVHLP